EEGQQPERQRRRPDRGGDRDPAHAGAERQAIERGVDEAQLLRRGTYAGAPATASQRAASTRPRIRPQPAAPSSDTSAARRNAPLNEPVRSTISPVTTGTMMPAVLAMAFWMLTQRATARGPATVCTIGQGELSPKKTPQRNRQAITTSGRPQAQPASPTATPRWLATATLLRTALSARPRAIRRSASQPKAIVLRP